MIARFRVNARPLTLSFGAARMGGGLASRLSSFASAESDLIRGWLLGSSELSAMPSGLFRRKEVLFPIGKKVLIHGFLTQANAPFTFALDI